MGIVLFCSRVAFTTVPPLTPSLSRGCPKKAHCACGTKEDVGEVASPACWKWSTCMFTGPAFHAHRWRPVSSVLNCLFSTPLSLF